MKRLSFFYILTILLFFLACSKDDDDMPPPTVATGDISGLVLDNTGVPLVGVIIEVMDRSAMTDSDGAFHLQNIQTSNEVLIKLSKSGYTSNFRTAPVLEDKLSFIRAALSPLDYDKMVDATQESEIIFNGAKVKLPANGIVNSQGQVVSGNINVKATYFDPTGEQYIDLFPGNFIGVSETGEEGLLESYGFIDVTLSQGSEILDLSNGATADISIPIPQEFLSHAPDPIPLFYFDEEDGIWKQEGSASIVDGAYVGSVSHFSSWNADFLNTDETCILKGRVVDQNGTPLELALVIATGIDFSGSNADYTDVNGRFSMSIKSDSRVVIYAQYTSLITGLVLGISDPILIDPTCPSGGMNDIGDIVIPLGQNPVGDSDTVWWDVFVHPYPVNNAKDEIDVWQVGRGGRIELCENCERLNETWVAQTSNTTETLLGVHFIDRDNGWVCGNNGTIKKTSNRGQSWETVTLNTFGNDLYEVEFIGDRDGWMVGSAGSIWYTHDGGQNWNQSNQSIVQDLYGMDFVTTEIGWAVGRVGKIFKTTNGGSSWSEQNSGTTIDLYGVSFVNQFYGWAVGLNGTLLYTEDGGNNWNPLNAGTNEDLLNIDFYQPNFGMIVGSNGAILTSTDRGSNWVVEAIGQQELWALDVHDYYGAIGGEGYSSYFGNPNLPTISDGWTLVDNTAFTGLKDVDFLNSTTGFIAGNNNRLLKTTDRGKTWNVVEVPGANQGFVNIDIFGNAIYLTYKADKAFYRSLDAGVTWDKLNETSSSPNNYFSQIQFASEERGWALKLGGDEFIYTTDYGDNWYDVPGLPTLGLENELILFDFEFLSTSLGFAAGYSIQNSKAVLYKTEDGGQSWQVHWENDEGSLRDLDFIDENIGYISDSDRKLYKTIDGGLSWKLIHSEAPAADFGFLNENIGWGIPGFGETLLFTDDGGKSWKWQGSSTGAIDINGIHMFDDGSGVAVGDYDKIYITEKGGF